MSKSRFSTAIIARMGMLTAVMLVLGLIERQFVLVPGVPGIKPGLSNAVLLFALCFGTAREAWLLLGLKVLLGGLLYAGVTGMLYGAAGGVCAMILMTLARRVPGLSPVGVSVLGALAHTAGQLALSRVLLGSWAALYQSPLLIVAAVVAGIVTGIVAQSVGRVLSKQPGGQR